MKTITKSQQAKLQVQYQYWRVQNNSPEDCIKFALQDLGMPADFCIDEYTIVSDTVKGETNE